MLFEMWLKCGRKLAVKEKVRQIGVCHTCNIVQFLESCNESLSAHLMIMEEDQVDHEGTSVCLQSKVRI